MLIDVSRVMGLIKEVQRYEKLEIEVKQLCGHNFECLRELFAMGYTLQPPERELTLTEITRLIDKE